MSKKSLASYVGWIVFSVLGAGCLPMNYYKFDSRRNVREETMLTIIPGQTTKEEVFLALGEPDWGSPNGREVIYHWETVKAWVGMPFSESVQKSDLIITFDERGVVVRREVKQDHWNPW